MKKYENLDLRCAHKKAHELVISIGEIITDHKNAVFLWSAFQKIDNVKKFFLHVPEIYDVGVHLGP